LKDGSASNIYFSSKMKELVGNLSATKFDLIKNFQAKPGKKDKFSSNIDQLISGETFKPFSEILGKN
jgi:hypothetical protein